MNWKSYFIKDVEEYIELNQTLKGIFHLEKEIPDQVFQKEFRKYLFKQFDFIMSEEFWFTIRELAERSKDDYVIMAVLNPNPMNYYYKEFGYFNWVKLPTNLNSNDYWNILIEGPQNSEADAIFYNSYILAMYSPSKKWGLWADRNFEISVIAFSDEEMNTVATIDSWLPVENDVVLEWLSYSFRPDFEAPESFSKKLRKNYPNNG